MATGAYDANGIWQYGEGDNIALFSDLLKLGTESTSAAFTADRARLATLEAGSLAGLIPLKAGLVSYVGGSVSVTTNGSITFTGVTSLDVRSIFSSNYRNYRLVATTSSSASSALVCKLMSGATTTSGSDYKHSGFYSVPPSTLVGDGSTSASSMPLAWTSASQSNAFTSDILTPFIASGTSFLVNSTRINDGQTQNRAGSHTLSVSYNGIQLYGEAGTISGVITIYGYNN